MQKEKGLDLDAVTVQDCIDMKDSNDCAAVLNDGKMHGFEKYENYGKDQKSMQWK